MQTCDQNAARDPSEEFLGKRYLADDAVPSDITELIMQHRERLAKELFYKANHQVISNLSRSTFVRPRQLKVLARRRVTRASSFDSAETASSLTEPQSPQSVSSRIPESSPAFSAQRDPQIADASLVSSFISEFEAVISQSITEQQAKCLTHVNEYLKKVCLSQLSQIASKVHTIVINPNTDLGLALLRLSCRKAKISKAQYEMSASIVARCSSDRALCQSDTYRTVVSLFQQLSTKIDQDC